jgi:hypothetical protein
MTNLKDINFGINQYCGPAVLSALTGKSTDECAAVISSINGKREIKAVDVKDLIRALEKLRFDVLNQGASRNCSLYAAFSQLVSRGDAMYIILVPRHVIACEVKDKEIYLIDNHSKSAINAAHSARLMQKVDAVYQVIKKSEPVLVKSEIRITKWPTANAVQVQRFNRYKDEKDNALVLLGQFSYANNVELAEISRELIEIANGRE